MSVAAPYRPPAVRPRPARVEREQRADTGQNQAVLDTRLTIETPEHIAFEFNIAGPFRRLMAYLLDLLISQVMYWLVVILFVFLVGMVSAYFASVLGPNVLEMLSGIFTAFVLLGAFAITWFYGAYLETRWNGQTIGKRMLSLRVLTTRGTAIDATQATLRNFFRLLDCMPFFPVTLLFGFDEEEFGNIVLPSLCLGLVMMALTTRFSRTGDWVAGTMVVYEPALYQAKLQEFSDPRVAALSLLVPSNFKISPSLSECLAHYVSRRSFLGLARSNEIAGHLVPELLERFRLPADTDRDLMMCALYHRAFLTTPSEADDVGSRRQTQVIQAEEVART